MRPREKRAPCGARPTQVLRPTVSANPIADVLAATQNAVQHSRLVTITFTDDVWPEMFKLPFFQPALLT
jgi:hypothetical protein